MGFLSTITFGCFGGEPRHHAFLVTDPALEKELLAVISQRMDRIRAHGAPSFAPPPPDNSGVRIASAIGWPFVTGPAAAFLPAPEVYLHKSKLYITTPNPDRLLQGTSFDAAADQMRGWAVPPGLQKIDRTPRGTHTVPSDRDLQAVGIAPVRRRLSYTWH